LFSGVANCLKTSAFLAIFSKGHEFLQNTVVISRAEFFAIFALGEPLFSHFQQTAPLCTKHRIQPEITTFCHFRTGRTTFLAIFSKVHAFVKKQRFQPKISTFCHFRTGRTTFLAKCTSLCKRVF